MSFNFGTMTKNIINIIAKGIIPLIVLALSGMVFALMWFFQRTLPPSPPQNPLPIVAVRPLERVDFQFRISSQGSIVAAKSIQLISELDGKAVFVSPFLKTGGGFEAGETLIKLDARDYELAATRAKAQVASAKLRLVRSEAEAKLAGEDWESLGRDGEATALLLHKPQLAEAQSALDAAEADLSKAKLNLERTTLIAPFDGRVRMASVETGQFVRRGESLATLFAIDRVEVGLPLPLSAFAFLDLPKNIAPNAFFKKPISVKLTGRFGNQSHHWRGEIIRVGGEVDVNSRMGMVFASISNPYSSTPPLRVGTFVEAEITGKIAKDVFVIPRVFLWEKDKALAVDQKDHLRIRELKILRSNRNQAIIQSGFEAGDRLCISAIEVPQDGAKVKVLSSK